MIWAITENLEVKTDSPNAPAFSIDIDIQEDITTDSSLLARHLLQLPDGSFWEITTRQTEDGFTTSCGIFEGAEMLRMTADTKESAMFNHFDVMTTLIVPTSETDPLP